MVFPHSSAGYRDERARGQAKAFETPSPPTGGFVFPPGYTAPPAVGTPPPPPPITIAPVAAGGAAVGAGVAFPIGALAAIAGGAYLGYEVRKSIKQFEKTAKLPFYDAETFIPSRYYSDERSYDVQYDWYGDQIIKDRHRRLRELAEYSEEYWETHGDPIWVGGEVYPGPGWYRRGYHYCQCAAYGSGDGTFRFGDMSVAKIKGYTVTPPAHCLPDGGNCGGLFVGTFNATPDVIAEPIGPLSYFNVYEQHLTLPRRIGVATYNLAVLAKVRPWQQGVPGTLVVPAYELGYGTALPFADPWANAVALPGSQPSLDEQVVGHKLPRGKAKRGYYVAQPINYPFTLVQVTGSAPVTVPDVVIDPVEDTVTIRPPSPPEYPSPEAGEFERKVRHRFSVAMFINVATESQDVLEAMHEGLPKRLRSKGRWGIVPDGDIILRDIILHWGDWDAQVAFEAFVNNQIEDHLLGKYYFRYGVGARGRSGDATKHIAAYLPQVHFANGQHSISIGEVEIDLVPAR